MRYTDEIIEVDHPEKGKIKKVFRIWWNENGQEITREFLGLLKPLWKRLIFFLAKKYE